MTSRIAQRRPRKVQPPDNANPTGSGGSMVSDSPALFLTDLTERRAALSKVNREEPDSPLASGSLEEREDRVEKFRGIIRDAYVAADADPSNGKWVFLSHLLRLGVTSGRDGRWVGTRKDIKSPPELDGEGMGWLITETEAEWNEWEKRVREERRLRDKVESWQRKVDLQDAVQPESLPREAVEPGPIKAVAPSSKDSRAHSSTSNEKGPNVATASKKTKVQTTIKAAGALDPLQDASPFGFNVVKRSSQLSSTGKPKDDKGNDDANAEKTKPSGLNIRNIPDFSFLPPSFPSSQMMTSTPKPIAKPPKPSKPAAIPHEALPSSSSSPLSTMQPPPLPSSPRVTKTYGRQSSSQSPSARLDASASLPAIPLPTTPTRHTIPKRTNEIMTNTDNKRPLDEADGERVLKKARTMPSPLLSLHDSRPKMPPNPHTPTRPTTIAADGSGSTIPGLGLAGPAPPVTPEPKHNKALPTLTDLLASAKKGRSTKKPSSKAKEVEVSEDPPQENEGPEDPIEDALTFELGPDLDIPQDLDLASPTKSLSSLAGSDSGEEEDEIEDDEKFDLGGSFQPFATSTQHPQERGPFVSKANVPVEDGQPPAGESQQNTDSWESLYAGGSGPSKPQPNPSSNPKSSYPASLNPLRGLPYPQPASSFPSPGAYVSYNSQFESAVAEEVDRVDKLLGKDVDYEGWLRDPYTDEPPEGEEAVGFGQNSLGVRDSFEVDESP